MNQCKIKKLNPGDLVLATKYKDGDPHDGWCIGFYHATMRWFGEEIRHLVVDDDGKIIYWKGYARAERISQRRAKFLKANQELILRSGKSVWTFKRCKLPEGELK
jgi:hypothetical protein